MMETTNTVSHSMDLGVARLRGNARGALICAIGGAVFMFQALYFGSIVTPVSLTVIAIFTVAVIVWPVMRLRSLRRWPVSAAERQRWARIAMPYWTDFAIEWLLCGVAVPWLVHIHRPDLIPQFLGAIVGLHFLPLAKIFKTPIYYATGAVMVLGVLVSLAIPPGQVRNIAALGVSGLSLWATIVFNLSCHRPSAQMKNRVGQSDRG